MLDIPVTVTRRRTSRLSIRVTKDGQVRVSAPRFVPQATIRRFVADHEEWIEAALKRAAKQQKGREAFYSQLDISTAARRREAVGRLKETVNPLIESYSVQMGVKPSGLRFSSAKTRWGSCNTKTRSVSLSLYLLLLPDWCIEHVVVHELAHLKVPNHSPRFYAVMDKYFPRWKEARKETRKLTNASHWDLCHDPR